MSQPLSALGRWLRSGLHWPGFPGSPGLPSPDRLPGLPVTPAPAPVLPVGSSSLSSTPGGASLPSLAAALPSSSALTPAMRRRLQPPPFWHPAVVVSLTERPG
jgi:hypothetical protein